MKQDIISNKKNYKIKKVDTNKIVASSISNEITEKFKEINENDQDSPNTIIKFLLDKINDLQMIKWELEIEKHYRKEYEIKKLDALENIIQDIQKENDKLNILLFNKI